MAKDSDSSERKMRPTKRRLRQARREGQVAKSRDLNAAADLIAALVAGAICAIPIGREFDRILTLGLEATQAPSPGALTGILVEAGRAVVFFCLCFAVSVGLTGGIVSLLQTGPVFATSRVAFQVTRLNPFDGLTRTFKPEAFYELTKGILLTALTAAVMLHLIGGELGGAMELSSGTASSAAGRLMAALAHLLTGACGVNLSAGILDHFYQKFAFERRLRMTRDEFKRDRKAMDGDPKIKSRRRTLYREWARHNAAEAAASATVVVTNPTRLAIALSYDPQIHAAPVLAAKGEGPMAAIIRAAAELAQVPLIENVALARELHELVEIDDIVPERLFSAVAEVIAWANRFRSSNASKSQSFTDLEGP